MIAHSAMKNSSPLLSDSAALWPALRGYIKRQQAWRPFLLALRSIWWLGPWRNLFIAYHQKRSKSLPLARRANSMFDDPDILLMVSELNRVGVAEGLQVPEEYVNRILSYCAQTKADAYPEPHLHCEAVRDIAHDPKVLDVVAQYLGAEPASYVSRLYWSRAAWAEPAEASGLQATFHYDVGDFKSLVLFVYLTDVDEASAPHLVIEGTHRARPFRQLLSRRMDEAAARRQFGDRIRVVTGARGAGFFEDVVCYHKRAACQRDRLILTIIYSLQRALPPRA